MTKIRVWHEGDPALGISGDQAMVEMDTSYMDMAEFEFLFDMLKYSFSQIWDFKAYAEVLPAKELFDGAV